MATKKDEATTETAEVTPPTAEEAAEKEARSAALREAYSTATKQLRVNHLDEFNGLQKAAAAALGYEWVPRPSPAEKAKAELDKLLAEHPELRDSLAG